MSTTISNDPALLKKMMSDLRGSPEIYQPGNYWKVYESKVVRFLESFDLSNLRHGVLPSGTIRSFGGGGELMRFFDSPYYPWDEDFRLWQGLDVIKKINGTVQELAKSFPPLKCFELDRLVWGERYLNKLAEDRRKQAVTIAALMDEDGTLHRIEDSKAGNPELIDFGGNKYSLNFLSKFAEYAYIKHFVDFSQIKRVVELGSGIGLQAAVFKKAEPHLRLCLLDIPPQLYVSHQYLSALFPKEVMHYEKAMASTTYDDDAWHDKSILPLGNWRIEDIEFRPDLFINSYSFQEMEREQVQNYLQKVKALKPRYFYLNNLTNGHFRASSKGTRGVINPASCDFMLEMLQDSYQLLNRRMTINSEGFIAEHEQMIFELNT